MDATRIDEKTLNVMMEVMSLIIVECRDFENGMHLFSHCRNLKVDILDMMIRMIELLSVAASQSVYHGWMDQNMSELGAIRSDGGSSIMHAAIHFRPDSIPRAPIVKMLAERGNIRVQVENNERKTPLHLLSNRLVRLRKGEKPTPDMEQIAELLIDNGAHMDGKDIDGNPASYGLKRAFPNRYNFDFNLKCLAAKVVIDHNIEYDNESVPKSIRTFIAAHACMPPHARAKKGGKKKKG